MSSEKKEAVRDFIWQRKGDLISLAQQLIAVPTPNPPGNERAAAETAADTLRNLGFPDIEIYEQIEQRANLICTFETGREGPTLLLNGHLDTKPPDPLSEWESDPYVGDIRDGRLYGLGAADMKGPDAALVYGLAAAVSCFGDQLSGKVLLALTADEEAGAVYGPRFLVEDLGIRADSCLIAEPCGITQNWEMLPLISRGVTCFHFRISGTQTHSSISDRIPVVNANLVASQLLVFLCERFRPRYPENELCPVGPTVNLGTMFHGGAGLAKIAGEAIISSDIRTLPGMTQATMTEDIEGVLAEFRAIYPDAQISWHYEDSPVAWTPPTVIAADHPLVQATARAAAAVLPEVPPLGYFPGGTDAIWWQGFAEIPTIPAFGPGRLPNCHRPNEYVEIDALVEAAQIYALLIAEYLGT